MTACVIFVTKKDTRKLIVLSLKSSKMNLNLKKPIGVTIAMQQGTQPTIVFGIQRISSKAKAKAEKARPKAKAEARGKEKVEKAKKEDELTEIFQPITNQKKHTTRKINGHLAISGKALTI